MKLPHVITIKACLSENKENGIGFWNAFSDDGVTSCPGATPEEALWNLMRFHKLEDYVGYLKKDRLTQNSTVSQ